MKMPIVATQEVLTEVSKMIGTMYVQIAALQLENAKLKKALEDQQTNQVAE